MRDGIEIVHDDEFIELERFFERGPGKRPGSIRETNFIALDRSGDSNNGKARSPVAQSDERFTEQRYQVSYIVILVRLAPQQFVRAADGNARIRAADIGD
jgi:hypothetical protein